MCIFVLKEVVEKYTHANSCVYASYLDASKAYDRVNHGVLFRKLLENNFPLYIVNILRAWYAKLW